MDIGLSLGLRPVRRGASARNRTPRWHTRTGNCRSSAAASVGRGGLGERGEHIDEGRRSALILLSTAPTDSFERNALRHGDRRAGRERTGVVLLRRPPVLVSKMRQGGAGGAGRHAAEIALVSAGILIQIKV
jgi:hypothetical protein